MNLKPEKLIQILSAVILLSSCAPGKKIQEPVQIVKPATTPVNKPSLPAVVIKKSADDIFFEELFKTDPGFFDKIIKNKIDWNVQIIYTEIKAEAGGKTKLIDHYFNKGGSGYFYPASSIKLPLALLALQKINEIKNNNILRNTTMITGAAYSGQTEVYNDPNTFEGKPSIEQYIKKAMLVNDNDACNRLYEFLGQEYINTELKKHGYEDAEILHRVGINLSEDENRHTNPVLFYDTLNRLLYTQSAQNNRKIYAHRNDVSGKGYMSAGKLINQPLDMSAKNRISLQSLHKMIASIYFPSSYADVFPFNISEDDRLFILKLMGEDPGESAFPFYPAEVFNGYTKYIYFGGEKYRGNPVHSYNTSGIAYGQMTDASVIADPGKNIEFIISATVYCNADGILNDDKYDYNTTGLSFLKKIGRALYEYELKKKKNP